jgi:hypothetical protein
MLPSRCAILPGFGGTGRRLLPMEDSDRLYLRAFESGELPNTAFHHRDHVHLAWLYLRRDGYDVGSREVIDGIRAFAAAHGAADRFHETLTRFWIKLVQHLIEIFPLVDRFDDLLARFPLLTDKTIVYRHYSRVVLASPATRQGWVMPDLRPLP